MALGGPAEWPEPYSFDALFIAGTWAPLRQVQEEAGSGCWALPTRGGTHLFQRPFRGAVKPKHMRALRFTFQVQSDSDAAWYAIKEARAACAPFWFGTGVRHPDIFAAVSGTTYRLTSPLAAGVVPGITEGDYPTIVKLDGVVDPSAATVSGQNVLANATGTITVTYTPVHLVYFTRMSEAAVANNDASLDIELDSILRP